MGKIFRILPGQIPGIICWWIPESLLPYPLKILEEALNMVAKHYHDIGDHKASELIRNSFRCLALYTEDEKALQNAAIKFNDSELKSIISSKMKQVQKNLIKTQQSTEKK